jgi:hypothetical protein
MPIHLDGVLIHAMSGTELSRVRTGLDPFRIFPTLPPHPVQPNSQSSGHSHLGLCRTHRQMRDATVSDRQDNPCCCFEGGSVHEGGVCI